uniref:Uncharacterized protein n=1 Tax=Arion vulgaris TaxID=1028688 RepID=A0A0B6YZ35_9EUPU
MVTKGKLHYVKKIAREIAFKLQTHALIVAFCCGGHGEKIIVIRNNEYRIKLLF